MSKRSVLAAALCIPLLVACQETTRNEVGAGVAGAAVGAGLAQAFDSNENWTILASLAGAAAGTMLARHQEEDRCIYSNGDGTYYEATCP